MSAAASAMQRAVHSYQAQHADEAERLCHEILGAEPGNTVALNLLAILSIDRSRLEQALDLTRRSLAINPHQPDALCNGSSVLLRLHRTAEALRYAERAAAIDSHNPRVLNSLGNALLAVRRAVEAFEAYSRAVALQPDYSKGLLNRGLALLELKRLPEALMSCQRALQLDPTDADAHLGHASILLALNRADEALAAAERALELRPAVARAHYARGNALLDLQRAAEALASFDAAISLDPGSAEQHRNRAKALIELQRPLEALQSLDRALELRPDYAGALMNRAHALLQLGRQQEAGACYQRVLQLDFDSDAVANLGTLLLGRAADSGVVDAERAAGAGDTAVCPGIVLHAQRRNYLWVNYQQTLALLLQAVSAGRFADLPLAFLASSDAAALQLRCARAYAERNWPHAQPVRAAARYRHQRIRLAYVSCELGDHPVSLLMAGVLEQHRRELFEVTGVSLRRNALGALGQRVTAAFDRLVDVSDWNEQQAAGWLREQETDICVDLTGYTEGMRTGIFAQRPAPLQVSYLGFPGTMGTTFMDYIIADEFVIPPHSRQHYAEQVVYLPRCFQPNTGYRAPGGQPQSRAQLGIPAEAVVLCCFNNSAKLTPALFDVWCRILSARPRAVLWMLAETPAAQHNLRREASQRGVAPARLFFATRVCYEDYLLRMQLADLFLDTLPFNGGTTVSDALRAGLPVLTCAGEAFAARMAGSLLAALGLPELIADSLPEYERRAIELSGEPGQLAALRSKLQAALGANLPFDAGYSARALEAAYLFMWQRHEQGAAPLGFTVQADGAVTQPP